MIKENYCPICKSNLTLDSNHTDKKISDYLCKFKEDHFFAIRMKNDYVSKIKVRVLDDDDLKSKLFIKVNFDENTTQVWKSINPSHQIKVKSAIDIDFSNISKIRNKIKTILIFS
jgi:hypothetical protein